MKKIRPFGIVFATIQCVLLVAVMLLPGHLAAVRDKGLGGLFWLALFFIAALLILLADAVWVAVVLRRHHTRHREVSPWRALFAWGIYLVVAVVAGPCVNFVAFAGEVPPLDVRQWATFLLLYVPPALIPALVLWLPAVLLSILDPNYRYVSKKVEK